MSKFLPVLMLITAIASIFAGGMATLSTRSNQLVSDQIKSLDTRVGRVESLLMEKR